MTKRAGQIHETLAIQCNDGDGISLVDPAGEIRVLLTFYGSDVLRHQGNIVEAVRAAMRAPLNPAFIRHVVDAANRAVADARPIGSDQGASIAVAYVAASDLEAAEVRYFVLGDCNIWIVSRDDLRQLPVRRTPFLGSLGVDVGSLVPRDTQWERVQFSAGERAVLAPALYSPAMIQPGPNRTISWPLVKLASTVMAVLAAALLLVLVFLALLGLVRPASPETAVVPKATQASQPGITAETVRIPDTPQPAELVTMPGPSTDPAAAPNDVPVAEPGATRSLPVPATLGVTPTNQDSPAKSNLEAAARAEWDARQGQKDQPALPAPPPQPTRALATPVLEPTSAPIPPTPQPQASTPTPVPTVTPSPPPTPALTATPAQPVPDTGNGEAAPPSLDADRYQVRLEQPPDGATIDAPTGRRELLFSWTPLREVLPEQYYYELVFWNQKQPEYRSPPGAGPATFALVRLANIFFNEPKFAGMLSDGPEFCWGVRAWDLVRNKESEMLTTGCRRLIYNAAAEQEPNRPAATATPSNTSEK
jgi:hypothetical protein